MPQFNIAREPTGETYFPSSPKFPPPPIHYQAGDLPLNAEQVNRFAQDRGDSVRKVLPFVWGIFVVLAIAVNKMAPWVDWQLVWLTCLAFVLTSCLAPWLAEWGRREEGWTMIRQRYNQTTETMFKPSVTEGVAVKTSPYPIRKDGEEIADEEHEQLMIMLRYVLRRCYFRSTAMPRTADKPYEVIPVANKQLTPKRFGMLIAVLEELELVTRARERERREVVEKTYEEARRKLDGSANRIRAVNFAAIQQRAEELLI